MGEDVKAYKTYAEQVGLLVSRGMGAEDPETAVIVTPVPVGQRLSRMRAKARRRVERRAR